MKEKKKSKRFNFLIYFFILVLGIFLIYFIVNQVNQRYQSIATSDMVNMVYNDEDNYDILSFEVVQNGDESTLNVQFMDKSTYKPNTTNGIKVNYYTTTVLTNTLTNSNFGNDGEVDLFSKLCEEVKVSETTYADLFKGGYIGFTTSIYRENRCLLLQNAFCKRRWKSICT